MTAADSQLLYLMLALPSLFGLTLVGEGVYKLFHYESGWISVLLGSIFLTVVAFGYFYLMGSK
jgi:hypothetical protein